MSTIKIAILGATASGKTAYITALHAVMQDEQNDFKLRSVDRKRELFLIRQWEHLVEGRWPPLTYQTIESFEFELTYQLKPLVQLELLEVKLHPKSPSDKSPNKSLIESQGIFLCLSGEHLMEKTHDDPRLQVGRMFHLLQEFRYKREDISDKNPFSVSIVITKYELCAHRLKNEIIEDIKKIFSPLFSKGSGFLVAICPVALSKPRNVTIPLMFIISRYFSSLTVDEPEYDSVMGKLWLDPVKEIE